MVALHQRFCKEPECREVRKQIVEVERELRQALDRRGQEKLLKLADLENELLGEISLERFLSGFKLALGIATELASSYSFDDDEKQRACEALLQRRGERRQRGGPMGKETSARGNWLPRDGRTWIFPTKPFPSASRPRRMRTTT